LLLAILRDQLRDAAVAGDDGVQSANISRKNIGSGVAAVDEMRLSRGAEASNDLLQGGRVQLQHSGKPTFGKQNRWWLHQLGPDL
jgi:hypothetical protein